MSNLAIIIAIENYARRSNISRVDFAENDARAFKKILMSSFKFKESEIETYINEEATLTTLKNDVRYRIKEFSGNLFIFYYVGHGFYSTKNLLTAYDSNLIDIVGTSLSLSDDIANNISLEHIKKSLIFIDSCASNLDTLQLGRGAVSNLDINEFSKYVKKHSAKAIYFSCSPGEKSYPSNTLQQGIWTHFLTKALSGNDEKAEERNGIITGQSLQDYLSTSIAEHIKNDRHGKIKQTPISKIFAQGTFEIIQFKKERKGIVSKHIDIDFDDYVFSTTTTGLIRNASGFKKGSHKIPTFEAYSFVVGILQDELFDPLGDIKDILINDRKIRLRDIEIGTIKNGSFIQTPLFIYDVSVHLDSEDLSEYFLEHSVQILSKGKIEDIEMLPVHFDRVSFSMKINTRGLDFINYISDLSQDNNIRTKHDKNERAITLFIDDIELKFLPDESSIKAHSDRNANKDLLEEARNVIQKIFLLT